MKVWIDDIRPAPKGWFWIKDSNHALRHLKMFSLVIEEISFDHDLGDDDTTVRVADYIEEEAMKDTIPRYKWHIHSANPVGRKRLQAALESANRFWDEQGVTYHDQ